MEYSQDQVERMIQTLYDQYRYHSAHCYECREGASCCGIGHAIVSAILKWTTQVHPREQKEVQS